MRSRLNGARRGYTDSDQTRHLQHGCAAFNDLISLWIAKRALDERPQVPAQPVQFMQLLHRLIVAGHHYVGTRPAKCDLE